MRMSFTLSMGFPSPSNAGLKVQRRQKAMASSSALRLPEVTLIFVAFTLPSVPMVVNTRMTPLNLYIPSGG